MDMERFVLSCEDAEDTDQWRLRIKGEPANPELPGKRPLKWCVCVFWHICRIPAYFLVKTTMFGTASSRKTSKEVH